MSNTAYSPRDRAIEAPPPTDILTEAFEMSVRSGALRRLRALQELMETIVRTFEGGDLVVELHGELAAMMLPWCTLGTRDSRPVGGTGGVVICVLVAWLFGCGGWIWPMQSAPPLAGRRNHMVEGQNVVMGWTPPTASMTGSAEPGGASPADQALEIARLRRESDRARVERDTFREVVGILSTSLETGFAEMPR